MSNTSWRRLSKPLVLLVGCAFLGGCSGQETIQLKKVDYALEPPPEGYKEKRKEFARKGASSRIKGDPSGVSN